jgi:photosystem II stability/assembly factor-like uncharacterized protein
MKPGKNIRKGLVWLALVVLLASPSWAGQWPVLGPDGGDARSLTYDPQNPDHVFLGTSTGDIFVSKDGGRSWSRFAHLGDGDDYVLDHIVINPRQTNIMFVAAWSLDSQQSGDLFRTQDGGKTWLALPDMRAKSVRALAMAPSDPRILVAGALDGVYRTLDGGDSWDRISPYNLPDIKNIESVAVDPGNPRVIYAGTWHLPWKTPDGGANWEQINAGMERDSDVFSVIVDSSDPSVVFASACSGIYRSHNAGQLFRRVRVIPYSARCARVLKQDPGNPAIIYAGTSEGLWKTLNSGRTWRRVTGHDVVVNDVAVDPRNSQRVLLATDRGGVLASDDGANTFVASNRGYTHRYVTSIVADRNDPNTIFVGVLNDREWGGMFVSRDSGQRWVQESEGLDGRDVLSLQQAGNGALIAGTSSGIFLLEQGASRWRPINHVVHEKVTFHLVRRGKKRVRVARRRVTHAVLHARVADLQVVPGRWLAATSAGLFTSVDEGKSWSGGPVLGKQDLVSVQASGDLIVATTRIAVLLSTDGGTNWKQAALPVFLTIRGVAITPDNQILIAAREGLYRSSDAGATWRHLRNGVPDKDISSIAYDPSAKRLLATSAVTGVVFESEDEGHSWSRGPDAGYPLHSISVVHGRFLAATAANGVVVQPESEARSASVGSAGASD